MKTAHLKKRRMEEKKSDTLYFSLMKKKLENSKSWLTKTLFSVLSPLISSFTLFLSDSFTFLPRASLTLSAQKKQKVQAQIFALDWKV